MGEGMLSRIIGGRDESGREKTVSIQYIVDKIKSFEKDGKSTREEKIIYYRCKTGVLLASTTEVFSIQYVDPTSPGKGETTGLLLWIHPVYPLSQQATVSARTGAGTLSVHNSTTSLDFESRLQKVYQGACSAIGHDFFRTVLDSICSWAGFYYSWISMFVPPKKGEKGYVQKLRILGFWHRDKGYLEDSRGVEYIASETPCSLTLAENVVAVPEGVRDMFPDNPFWQVLDPVPTSYVAMAILDTQTGEYLGNVGMMDTEAGLEGLIGSPEHVKVGLRVFAERVGAELKRMRMEEALASARKDAVTANEAKSLYMNHLNHELRTPLNAVIGTSELLEDTTLTPPQLDLVETLRSSGAHLLTVINDVLDLTKIELGNVTLSKDRMDVAAMLEEVVRMVRPSDVGISSMQKRTAPSEAPRPLPSPESFRPPISLPHSASLPNGIVPSTPESQEHIVPRSKRKKVELRWEMDTAVPKMIEADRGRLRQILINLLANGYKFTDEGHVIARCRLPNQDDAESSALETTKAKLGVGSHEILSAGDPITLQFEVQDTGPGVPADKAEDLFRPFVQLETTKGKHNQGSGLGLSIAQNLVRLMGGEIWVKLSSSPDLPSSPGTTIAFTIQTHVAAVPEQTPDRLRSLPRGVSSQSAAYDEPKKPSPTWDRTLSERLPLKIILAEDDLLNARIARTMFGKFGFAVPHVINGVQLLLEVAKAIEEGWMYDVIYCDMFMPEMDGYTAIVKLKELFKAHPQITRLPRFIALTANASSEDRLKCLSLGMSAYMTKPLTIQELYDSLVETGRLLEPDQS
ncbi:hypothetical protein HKX48_000528 [Thoreauomyces humboldtii]|nr:hypothetical protein HKX48_000528 [Thoreauomyces humboldtii]